MDVILRSDQIYRILYIGMKIKQKILLLVPVSITGSAVFSNFAYAAVEDCGGYKTSILGCPDDIKALLTLIVKILSAGVLVAAVAGLIFGAVMYMTAGGSADNTKKGITIIGDVIIGLVAYGLMYVILNFLIPGGISII